MIHNFSTQTIGLEGVINARELGGYVLPGGTIKKGKLLRGGNLYHATPSDLEKLEKEFDTRWICDFRMVSETMARPNQAINGATDIKLPAMDPEMSKGFDDFFIKGHYRNIKEVVIRAYSHPEVKEAARMMYSGMVVSPYTHEQYARFMRICVESEGAVYWHCTQGKDRTGLGAAFLLAALGADRDLIMRDYSISQEFYEEEVAEISAQILAEGATEEDLVVVKTFIGVNEDYFEQSLDLIDQNYGSMQDFLHNQLKLSDQDIATLRKKYLE